jgi:hypothetical protein
LGPAPYRFQTTDETLSKLVFPIRFGESGKIGLTVSGARAGIVAAAVWAAAEPLLGRALGTTYSDVRLLGRAVTRRRAWPVVGVAMHLANGAVFGGVFSRLGLRGVREGVLAAQAENLALWPGFVIADRVHPDRRDGSWPPLLTTPRILAYEVATHTLFGAVLGRLLRDR